MSESEERNQEIPNGTADAETPTRAPEEPGRTADRNVERRSRLYGWILTAGVVGWNFASAFLRKNATSNRTRTVQTGDGKTVDQEVADGVTPVRAPEETGRAADANRNLENGSDIVAHPKWGTLFVTCAFAMGIVAGVGFLIVYWSGGNNLLLGGTLALCLGGFGSALVFSARWLMPHRLVTEAREKLPSSPDDREGSLEAFCAGAHDVRRRSMLKWMGAAGMGLLAAMVISLMRSLGVSPAESLFSTVWKSGQRLMTADGKPITIDSLHPGDSITVFPESSIGSEKSQTVLVRVHEQLLRLPKDRANWAPMGYVAYSRVCTHAGCPVGLFESGTNLLLCPCHQSTFDVLRAARPTAGPAARPLPQLPLYADSDGNLRAGGGFSSPPGPGFMGMPS